MISEKIKIIGREDAFLIHLFLKLVSRGEKR